MDQLIIGCAEQRAARVLAVAGSIDQRLRMLDAQANREWLGLDIDAALINHLEGIARTVADGEHQMISCDVLAIDEHHTGDLPVLYFDIIHATTEADLAAQRLYRLAHFLHHAHQPERADMRMALV